MAAAIYGIFYRWVADPEDTVLKAAVLVFSILLVLLMYGGFKLLGM